MDPDMFSGPHSIRHLQSEELAQEPVDLWTSHCPAIFGSDFLRSNCQKALMLIYRKENEMLYRLYLFEGALAPPQAARAPPRQGERDAVVAFCGGVQAIVRPEVEHHADRRLQGAH